MRWAATAELVDVATEVGPDGSTREARTGSTVFANVRSVGSTAWLAARSAGLHADAEVAVRTCDYAGQACVVLGGVEYEVERAAAKGEDTVLTLKRRLSNA